jgi:hypothetical protein
MRNSIFRRVVALLVIGMSGMLFNGCGKSDPYDGKVYHPVSGGPMTFEFKGGKCKVDMGGDVQTLDYKLDEDKITIINPNKQQGDIVLNRHPDGSLTSPLGELVAK